MMQIDIIVIIVIIHAAINQLLKQKVYDDDASDANSNDNEIIVIIKNPVLTQNDVNVEGHLFYYCYCLYFNYLLSYSIKAMMIVAINPI